MNKIKLYWTAIFLVVLITSLPLASAYSLTYDANGNLITGDGKFRIYDGFNHLVQVRTGDNATAPILENYTWHPVEDRIVIKDVYDNGSWKETVYYPSKDFVRVENSSGTYDYKYIYQNGQLVAQEDYAGNKLFMHADHLGSTSLVTNESGAVVEETFYSPFGEIISGGSVSRFDYEAKEFDSVVGDYDFHARKVLINPPIFAQPDSNIQDVYNPPDLNRYTFERNNPYKYKDETGHYASPFDVMDYVSLADSINAFSDEPSWSNAGWIALDVGFSLLPFVGGIGMASKTIKYGEPFISSKSIAKNMDNTADAAKAVKVAEQTKYATRLMDIAGDSGFANKKLLKEHWEKHGIEFGKKISMSQYESMARTFAQSQGKHIAWYTRTKGAFTGDIVKFNKKTNEFLVISGQGNIRTYYKADYTYYLQDIAKNT